MDDFFLLRHDNTLYYYTQMLLVRKLSPRCLLSRSNHAHLHLFSNAPGIIESVQCSHRSPSHPYIATFCTAEAPSMSLFFRQMSRTLIASSLRTATARYSSHSCRNQNRPAHTFPSSDPVLTPHSALLAVTLELTNMISWVTCHHAQNDRAYRTWNSICIRS